MPRKKKTTESEQTNGAAAPNGSAAAPAPRKKRAPRRTKTAAAAPKRSAENIEHRAAEISDEAIRLRAYFIAEERLRRSLPGDAESDWLEARRQLLDEQNTQAEAK